MVRTIRQERVVGLEDEEETIINHLMKDQTTLDVISIIGMPGLGKTTLAWKVFSNNSIGFEFPIRIWVHFSEMFNCRDVLVQIMQKFTNNIEDLNRQTDQELSSAVFKCLSQEKFLLVVDDVWETEHWDEIKHALPYSNGKGKVLITSREKKVGTHVREITEPHQQKPLKPKKSWELLQWEVFGKLESCPDELKKIGNRIAEKCEGIPLTIVVIGGVLKDQITEPVDLVREKWEKMASNENLVSEDKKKVIADIVALSYKRLPDNLRNCFLYLGVIPAGYEIPTWTLTRLWIAEGFIQPGDDNQSLEKTAEEYLNDLISRNLLIVRKTNAMHEVKVCRVHDIIRVFCISEASKQNLFQEIRMSDEEEDGALASKMEKIHRLCLHSNLEEFLLADAEGPHVRSFLCFRKDAMDLDPGYNSVIPDNFRLLRILQSKPIKFNKFPQNITKLIHLRYIVLCVPDLTLLPEQISQLWNLQTIVVDTNSDKITMKANLWKMMRLRHVKTKAAIFLLDKKKIEGEAGKNLQTLNRLSPESVTSTIVEKAKNLKTLGIRGKLAPLFDDMHLEKMSHLQKLKLYQAATEKGLQYFPDSTRFPSTLKRLTLSNTFLDWNHMSTLAMIGDLKVLKLKNNAFKGVTWKSVNYVFRSLRFLLILVADMVVWEDSANAFPSLRHLELKNCDNLKEIPDSVLQNLENLDIDRVPKSIAEYARKLGPKIKLSVGPGVF